MRVFITGASGHVGSAVLPELRNAGHQVVALARSDAAAQKLEAAGAEVRRGDLDDLDGIRKAATDADGVIHLAFRHDVAFSGGATLAAETDLNLIEAVGSALEGSGKPLVITGVTTVLAHAGTLGRPGTEEDIIEGSGYRIDSENATIALAERGVRPSVIRLPPVVHSDLDKTGFTPTLIGIAREKGVVGYLGDGANHWPAVHTRDTARLYRLALESAPAGSRLHAVAEEGVRFREIAEAIGRNLGLPAVSVPAEDATKYFGFLGGFVAIDNRTSNALTRKVLGWEPSHAELIADIDEGHYFA
ncbi:SDR family oxidoreductase [Amycolatopsis pithecellobii]|uniref:NAD-dependent epimerase/dehydratase family protein n=1 Tax=Amycolatopsis pithecellobii TaxID=664692 RepID=A0A6N7YV60_9PSEU|nr:SDR family oxidoreductase [Amycolatopsis pithecellobii]MTD56967.1 NAD-dependent epimerase/dehydratase family protein [Amycolatopsis pithecellobii]